MCQLFIQVLRNLLRTTATSTPQGLLVGSRREHPFHLSGLHTQQSLTNWHFIPWPIWSPLTGRTSPTVTVESLLVPTVCIPVPNWTHTKTRKLLTPKLIYKSSSTSELSAQQLPKNPRAALQQLFICRGSWQSFQLHQSAISSVLYIDILGFQPLTPCACLFVGHKSYNCPCTCSDLFTFCPWPLQWSILELRIRFCKWGLQFVQN